MQALAHQLHAGQNHTADVPPICEHAVDGGGGACTEDDVLLLGAQHLRTEQLGVAVAAHLGGIGVGEFKAVVLRRRLNHVWRAVRVKRADELLDLIQYLDAGDAADAALCRRGLVLPNFFECVEPLWVVVRECGRDGVGQQRCRVVVKVPFDSCVADVDEQCGRCGECVHERARS